MLKIKNIEFIKAVYDDSLSHNIFSIANIEFSNYPPINGALLYWRKNYNTKSEYTPEGDYKFYYDMANGNYFASVKFPKNVKLTRDQKQELAFILLDERGSIGSYSLKTHKNRKNHFNPKNSLENLEFPEYFQPNQIPSYVGPLVEEKEIEAIIKTNPTLTKEFIEDYCYFRYQLARLHPTEFEAYLEYVDFSYICYACDQLSEKYLIEHLDQVDVSTLQYNYPVLSRLSASFKKYMVNELKRLNTTINQHFEHEIDLFIEDETYFSEYGYIDLMDENIEIEEEIEYLFFEYERGPNKWYGSEHLIKGIPSFRSQVYDDLGYKKPTNKEMDVAMNSFTPLQISLLSAILEPHWLHRYREIIDWKAACLYNQYFTDDFLIAHMNYVQFEALGQNLWCEVSEQFIETYMNCFNHNQPVPFIIRHLTEQIYLNHKDTIQVDSDLLYQYYPSIGDDEYEKIQSLLED